MNNPSNAMNLVQRWISLMAILLMLSLLPACGKSKPNQAAAPTAPKATATPKPTPVPIAEKLNALVPEEPPFEKLKPLVMFREDEYVGMGVMVDESFIITALDFFPGAARPKKSVAQIAVMPSGKPIYPPKPPTEEAKKAEEGNYYYYQEVGPEVSSKYSLLRARPNHAAQQDAVIAEAGPRYQIAGFWPPRETTQVLRFSAQKEKRYISVLTGREYLSNAILDLDNTPENRHRPTQIVLPVNSEEEPLALGYPFATPGERLIIVNRIETLTDDIRSSLTLAGTTIPEGADKVAIGGLLPRYLDYEQKYGVLMATMTEDQVSEKFEPVFIYRNEEFHGSGTLVHDGDSSPLIVSTRHQFSEGDEALFAYQRLRPLDMENLHPLKSVRGASNEHVDIVIAEAGDGGELKGVPRERMMVDPNEDLQTGFGEWLDPTSKRKYTSLLTGLTYDGYSILDADGNPTPHIMLFYTIIVGQGESGSGFVRDDGRLFTLAAGMELRDQIREEIEAAGLEMAPEVDWLIFGALVPDEDF